MEDCKEWRLAKPLQQELYMRIFPKPSLVLLTLALAGGAFAAGHISEDTARAMEARQSHMTLYSFNLATVGGMAQDKIPYDAAMAASAAGNLAALASVDQSAYWVEGSDNTVEGSKALPVIWTDMAGFEAKQQELATATTALAAAAGDGLDALKGAFGPVGQTCGGCHRTYREPNN